MRANCGKVGDRIKQIQEAVVLRMLVLVVFMRDAAIDN